MNPNYSDQYGGYGGYNDGRSNSPQVAYDRKHGAATPVNYQPYNNQPPQQHQQLPNPYANAQQQPPMQFYNPLSNPVAASIAAQYGANLADQGKEYLAQNVDRWFSISKLRYYFAVDTNYVAKKLSIILFPYLNRDWTIRYNQAEAVPPKLDVNAPDMYIPLMAFLTYILMAGLLLGTKKEFSPEVLGMHASYALGWFAIEVFVIFIVLQVLGLKSALKTFDIMAFCGYKYFGMIVALLASLLLSSNGYWLVLAYLSLIFPYFIMRNLRVMILVNNDPASEHYQQQQTIGAKRRIYVILFVSLLQPFFIWLLTRHLV